MVVRSTWESTTTERPELVGTSSLGGTISPSSMIF
jgi:hypothetical protein